MATQTLEQGRYPGGARPGYRLGDAGPHPNKAYAEWGRRAHRLEPDPATAPVATWISAQRTRGTRAAGVEPAAVRRGPGRLRRHRAWAQASAAEEPVRGLGHLQASRARGAGQRGRLRQPPGHRRVPGPGRAGGAPVPADRLLTCGRCGRRLESACPTTGPPIGAVTATPAPPSQIPPGRRPPTCARTRYCPTWQPLPSSASAAGRRTARQVGITA